MVLGNCFLDHCLTSLSSWTVSPFWATLNHFRPLWPKILASQQSPHFLWHPVMMRVMMVMRRTMMMVNTKKHLLHPSLLLLPPFSSHLPACIFCWNIVKYLSTLLLNILICYFSIYQYSLLPSSHHIDNISIDPIPMLWVSICLFRISGQPNDFWHPAQLCIFLLRWAVLLSFGVDL